jgi:hypothetical protein
MMNKLGITVVICLAVMEMAAIAASENNVPSKEDASK